jgi:two-component sensor histidine kinase
MGDDAHKLRKQVAALARFGEHAFRNDEIGELLQEATELVSEGVEVDLVKVLELLPDGQNLLVRAGVNWNPGVVGKATVPAGSGSAAGHALRTNAPVISDVATEKRFTTPRLLLDHGVKSTVNVVIRGKEGPFGVLEVDSRQQRSFGQDDIDFLQNYANLLASALDRTNKQKDLTVSLENQHILVHELQHRVNNMLMTIRAVARLTREKSKNLDEFASALDHRLSALARSHALLSQPGRSAASVREVLVAELSAQGAVEDENVTLNGPEILLPSKRAQALSMAFHELATNAVKHGALSVKEGRIHVSWNVERTGELTRLLWREHGLSIDRNPVRRGYGSEILERAIPEMLGGSLSRTFHPDGMECVILFRIDI